MLANLRLLLEHLSVEGRPKLAKSLDLFGDADALPQSRWHPRGPRISRASVSFLGPYAPRGHPPAWSGRVGSAKNRSGTIPMARRLRSDALVDRPKRLGASGPVVRR